MSLESSLIKGALLGVLSHVSFQALKELNQSREWDADAFGNSAFMGFVTGIALAAIASFGGRASAIGAGCAVAPFNMYAIIGNKDTILKGWSPVAMVFGATIGYALREGAGN